MLIDEQPLFNIREYSIGSVSNRNQFISLDFAQTLQGKRESFQSYFLHTEQISNYAQAQLLSQGKISVTGYKGIVSADCLLIDVDVKDNLPLALEVARALANRIVNEYHIPFTSIRIRFSGSKGFHFIIPAELFSGFIPSATLPALHSALAGKLCKGYEEYIDLSIYHTVSLIRIENTQNAKSNLFCIPLTFEELQSMSIDEIKKLAEQPRYPTTENTEYVALDSLIQLMQTCLQPVNNVVIENKKPLKSSTLPTITVTPPNVEKINTMFRHCSALHSIEQKSLNKELIVHEDRVALGTVLTAFGEEGKTRVHKLLEGQENYKKEQTSYYLDAMNSNGYKPELCLKICGEGKLCPAIRAINRKSPIAFAYTYDEQVDGKIKKFIESYALDKIVAHFNNIIYATVDQSFYHYDSGVYNQISDNAIKSMIDDFLPFYFPKSLITNTYLNALVERMKTASEIRFEGRFNADKYKINLTNGIFDLMSKTISAHTPEFMSNIQLPFSYDATAKCPVFDAFLLDVFDNDKEIVEYIMKIWCYLLIPTYSYQKIFVWYGSGRNGKGVLSRIITAMLGDANVAHEDIHELAGGRFSPINLKDKLLNFSSELKTNDLDMAMLKKLSGGDMIAADKKYKDKITFQNVARLIILANDLPRFSEIGTAITQRFEFIEFKKEYLDAAADTNLDDKLSAELAGIFNRLVSMMSNIFNSDGAINFKAPAIIEENKKSILSSLSTIIEFVRERCEAVPNTSIRVQTLYESYKVWASASGYKAFGKKTFNTVLRNTLKLKMENSKADQNQLHVYEIKKIDLGFLHS
jgi:P4 family phage/plasmid primase-like protien